MSSKKWRNAVIILLMLAGLVFLVENILEYFLASSAVPDIGIQETKESLTSIFRVFIVFALAGAIVLAPVWIFKRLKERKGSYEIKEPRGEKGGYVEYDEKEEKE